MGENKDTVGKTLGWLIVIGAFAIMFWGCGVSMGADGAFDAPTESPATECTPFSEG